MTPRIAHNRLLAALLGAMLIGALPGAPLAQSPDLPAQIKPMGQCHDCAIATADMTERALMGVDLARATITDVRFDRAELTISIFNAARLERVSFADADLRGASFVGARLVDVNFAGADLRGAVFEGAVLERTDLSAALLCNTQMPDDEMDNTHCN